MVLIRPQAGEDAGLLKIGEAATLTGVSAGRIRHYQSQGLLNPVRSPSGYRYFRAAELLRLLQIDLLRSLGMGIGDIRESLPGQMQGDSLRDTLQRHRATLQAERDRVDRLVGAIDLALASEEASAETVATLLAAANSTPRDSLGIFGRLSKPLSEGTASIFQEILGGGWGLPVPSMFGRMLLPGTVSELLEDVAQADGYPELFRRVRDLASSIMGLSWSPATDREEPEQLAQRWLRELARMPLPVEVQAALDRTIPRIREREVLNQGFQLWAESISPPAALVLRSLESIADQEGLLVLGVLLAKRQPKRPHRAEPART